MSGTDTSLTSVELIRNFVNTLDVDEGTDALASPEELTDWLAEHDLLPRRTPSTQDDLTLARTLRSGLRDALAARHDDRPVESAELRTASAALPLQMQCCGEAPRLEPVHSGARGALSRILAAVNEARVENTWERLKLCPDDSCRWAFYDATKNQSKNWCCAGCGNKAKTRNYRQRQKAG